MSDYAPDVSAFRCVYGQMYSEWRRDDALAEFDRFIARIKAEAWDEGHSWGWSGAQDAHDVRQLMVRADWPQCALNPYRKDESNE